MFHYTRAMEAVVGRVVEEMDAFRHIDLRRLLIAWTPCRESTAHGTFAKIVPLRFENGARTRRIGRRIYQMPLLEYHGREILYLVYFYLPRFHNLDYREKLITIVHELYHVAPAFNGDIRRFPGKNFAHGTSRKNYNALMALIADELEARAGAAAEFDFLRHDFDQLRRKYGPLSGRRVTLPRPVPVPASRLR